MEFILASQSPRRKELLTLAGIEFRVVISHVEEMLEPHLTPSEQVLNLAKQKADAVVKDYPSHTVIGADTIVVLDGVILGKPLDKADAFRMLKALSGRSHQVMTGVSVVNGNHQESFINVTDVEFYEMSDEWILTYIESGQPMDKAGSYGIQDSGFELVKEIKGDYYSVMGLPIAQLKHRLRELQLV